VECTKNYTVMKFQSKNYSFQGNNKDLVKFCARLAGRRVT
jgi:hypothetical protein